MALPTVPACRHADGTISSSRCLDVRRVVSEGSCLQKAADFPADCLHHADCNCRFAASTDGFSGFPAYSQMRTPPLLTRGAAISYLRTVRAVNNGHLTTVAAISALYVAIEIGPYHLLEASGDGSSLRVRSAYGL